MQNILKRFLSGEETRTFEYTEDTPLEVVLEDVARHTPEGKELTELEFFNEDGKRVQHWIKESK